MSVQENFTEKFRAARNYKIIKQFTGKTASEISEGTGISKQNLSTWENEKGNPGSSFIDLLSNYFRLPRELFFKDDLTIEYLQSMKNSTSVQNEAAVAGKSSETGQMITTLFELEKVGEYRFIPKKLLDDYDLFPKSDVERRAKDRDKTIEAMEKYIANLERENAELRSGRMTITVPEPAKKT